MSPGRTRVLAAVLVLLAVEFWLFEGDHEGPSAPHAHPPALVECGAAVPDRLTISAEGRSVEAVRENGAWAAPGGPLASAALASLAEMLCRLPVLDRVADAASRAEFGLSPPRATVTGTVAGSRFALALGRATPLANQVYVAREERSGVLIVGAELASGVERALAATAPAARPLAP